MHDKRLEMISSISESVQTVNFKELIQNSDLFCVIITWSL